VLETNVKSPNILIFWPFFFSCCRNIFSVLDPYFQLRRSSQLEVGVQFYMNQCSVLKGINFLLLLGIADATFVQSQSQSQLSLSLPVVTVPVSQRVEGSVLPLLRARAVWWRCRRTNVRFSKESIEASGPLCCCGLVQCGGGADEPMLGSQRNQSFASAPGIADCDSSCSVLWRFKQARLERGSGRWYDAAGLAVWWRFRWREEV
jgi:hypothetical protein